MNERLKVLISIGKHLPIAIFLNFLMVIASKEFLSSPWWLMILAFIGYAGWELFQKKVQGGTNTLKHQTIVVGVCLFSYALQALLISEKYF